MTTFAERVHKAREEIAADPNVARVYLECALGFFLANESPVLAGATAAIEYVYAVAYPDEPALPRIVE